MMLSTVISTRPGVAAADRAAPAGALVWADGKEMEKAARKAAATPTRNRVIDV
jgi:hypothetical protein